MDAKKLLLHPDLHPSLRGLPRTDHLLLQIQKILGRPQNCLRSPIRQHSLSQTPTVFPLPLRVEGPRLKQIPYTGPLVCSPPPRLVDKTPSPPLRKHLPVDALAHLTLPLQERLTLFPLVLHAPPPTGTNIPPPDLMRKTY